VNTNESGFRRHFLPKEEEVLLVCTFFSWIHPIRSGDGEYLAGQRKRARQIEAFSSAAHDFSFLPHERTATTTWYVRGLQLQAVHTV